MQSAVIPTAIPSVCLSVRHKLVPYPDKWRQDHGLGELPKILWFHFNIYTVAEARDLKFGTQLGFAQAHNKTTPRENMGVALG